MNILAIETSCDETAIAILNITGSKQKPVFRLLSNVVLSQIKIHKPFGGVVPNLAQREHQKNLPFILKTALQEAKLLVNSGQRPVTRKKTKKDKLQLITNHSSLVTILNREPELWRLFQKHILPLKSPPIDAVAVTHGPGLESALWVGINFAKALAVLWEKPLIPVNHLEGHIYASWLVPLAKSKIKNQKSKLQIKSEKKKTHHLSLITHHYPKFPLLALIVSGGHTELVLIKKHLHYKILGETRDDAAGEAFDKVAKMLGLGYPGGPKISRLAGDGNPTSIKFPRPMINSNNYDFSFSGLKTAVLYYLKNKEAIRLPLGNRIAKSKKFRRSYRHCSPNQNCRGVLFRARYHIEHPIHTVDKIYIPSSSLAKHQRIAGSFSPIRV